MTTPILSVEDLAPFATIDKAKAEAMVADALALAERVAPCITEPDFKYPDAVRAILRGAVLRWNDAGSGAASQLGSGPFQASFDTRQPRRAMLVPSEVNELAKLCQSSRARAFTIDTMPVRETGNVRTDLLHSWVNGPAGYAPGETLGDCGDYDGGGGCE